MPAPRPAYVPATVREDWAMPPCPVGYRPVVYNTGDGWYAHWFRDDDSDCIDMVGAWPFVEDVARGRDWEALGFEEIG